MNKYDLWKNDREAAIGSLLKEVDADIKRAASLYFSTSFNGSVDQQDVEQVVRVKLLVLLRHKFVYPEKPATSGDDYDIRFARSAIKNFVLDYRRNVHRRSKLIPIDDSAVFELSENDSRPQSLRDDTSAKQQSCPVAPSYEPNPTNEIEELELHAAIYRSLSDIERRVFTIILDKPHLKHREIAEMLDISRSYVSYLVKNIQNIVLSFINSL